MAVFGAWNSSGEHGGAGTKFPRALSSEIVGLDAIPWIKVASRIDPLAIPSGAEIYEPLDDSIRYTSDPEEAKRDNKSGKPIPLAAKGGKAGRPALVNHSNVLPNTSSGGVTISKAVQTTLLSLAHLRKLSFPKPDGSRNGDLAARTALAALALVAIAWQLREGYALRSRCDLVPVADPEFEIVYTATRTARFTLDPQEAVTLLSNAVTALRDTGLTWGNQAVRLTPDPRLVKLIIKGRELADTGQDETTDAS
jgi:CRISPR-associated protein Csb1